MEFGEHEHQEEEMEISMHHQQPLPVWEGGVSMVLGKSKLASMWYRECLKNNVVGIGGSAVDCCSEFMAATEEGTLDLLNYAARNFHRKETDDGGTAGRADIRAQELIFGERLGLRNASIERTTRVLTGFLSYEALSLV